MSEPVELKTAIKNFTEEHAAELTEVEAEIVALVNADSGLTYQEIEGRLGTIYADAEARGDTQTMQLATEAYYHAQELVQTNGQLLAVATGATYGLRKSMEEHEELIEAIEEQDEYHPLIGDLIEAVRDQTQYEAEIYACESAHEDAYECMANNCRTLLGMEDSGIIRLFSLLVVDGFTGYGVSQVDDATMRNIGAYIEKRLAQVVGAKNG